MTLIELTAWGVFAAFGIGLSAGLAFPILGEVARSALGWLLE